MQILAVSIDEDRMAPRQAVEALSKMYSGARTESLHLVPADYAAESIGHFGFFKDYFRETLWQKVLTWLESASREESPIRGTAAATPPRL